MTTTTDNAKTLRAALKAELGLNARGVSVRRSRGTLSLRIEVKDPAASLVAVEKIAKRFESVRRCEVTHEILSGGNTFVSVSWSPEAKAARGERFAGLVEAAAAKLDGRHGVGVPVGDTGAMLWMSDFGGFEVTKDCERWHGGPTFEGTGAALADLLDRVDG